MQAKETENKIVYAVSTQLPDKKLLSEKLQWAITITKGALCKCEDE